MCVIIDAFRFKSNLKFWKIARRMVIFVVNIFLILISTNSFAVSNNRSIVVSIKPIHSLVSGLLVGTNNPPAILLLSGQSDPHDFSLTPSQVKQLNQASLVFTISPEVFETNLKNTLQTLPQSTRVFRLLETPDLKILLTGGCVLHDHSHKIQNIDPHIWLSPYNAIIVTQSLTEILSDWDPEQATQYRENSKILIQKIKTLDQGLKKVLNFKHQKQPSYLVFHNGYQYFQKYYHLKQAGCIFYDAAVPLSGQRLQQILNQIQTERIQCIFGEPQMDLSALKKLLQSKNKLLVFGSLDPLGMGLEPGPDCYFQILKNLANGYQVAFKAAIGSI
jgi:zinc transport system substrate-binding protein